MSLLAKRILLQRTLLTGPFHHQCYSTGFRVRFDPKRPREPNFEKKLLLAVMEPSYRSDSSPQYVKCAQKMQQKQKKETHPYVLLQAEQCRRELDAPFVYLFHMNPTKSEELRTIKVSMLKKDVHFRQYSIEVLENAMLKTKFSTLTDILIHYGVFCFSDKNKIAFLNKMLKKHPSLILLGAIAENRVMNKEQLTEYTNLPSIDVMRAQLCHTLSSPAIAIHSALNYHLTDLSESLQRRAEGQKKE